MIKVQHLAIRPVMAFVLWVVAQIPFIDRDQVSVLLVVGEFVDSVRAVLSNQTDYPSTVKASALT